MAGLAKTGVLQRLELPEQDHCCISRGPDFKALCGIRLLDGLLQPAGQLTSNCTEFGHCTFVR